MTLDVQWPLCLPWEGWNMPGLCLVKDRIRGLEFLVPNEEAEGGVTRVTVSSAPIFGGRLLPTKKLGSLEFFRCECKLGRWFCD